MTNEGRRRSTTKLTDAQQTFFMHVRLRAVTEGTGQPYISPALFRLTPVNAPGLRTMSVDKYYRVYIDFDYMMAMPESIM